MLYTLFLHESLQLITNSKKIIVGIKKGIKSNQNVIDIDKRSDPQSFTINNTLLPKKSSNFTPSEASTHRSDSSCLP